MKIYYAHHQWKYGTQEEAYELELIRREYPDDDIFNPATDLETYGLSEEEIMENCIEEIDKSDMVIFSSLDGCIGIGCYREVSHAKVIGIDVGYITCNRITDDYAIGIDYDDVYRTDRIYATVI